MDMALHSTERSRIEKFLSEPGFHFLVDTKRKGPGCSDKSWIIYRTLFADGLIRAAG